MKKQILGAVAAVAFACAAVEVQAATYTLTVEGVITGGSDLGTFGVGGDLAGYGYKSVYVVDVARPGAVFETGPGYSKVSGQGATNPFLSAAITVNGVTFNVDSGESYYLESNKEEMGVDSLDLWAGFYSVIGGFDANGVYYYTDRSQLLNEFYSSEVNDIFDGDIFTAPGSHVFTLDDSYYGTFYDYHVVSDGYESPTIHRDTWALMQATKVTVTTGVAAVPEPGAWALMIMGFMGVGSALRRRRALEA